MTDPLSDLSPPERRTAFTLTPEDYAGALQTTLRDQYRKPLSIVVHAALLLGLVASLALPNPEILGAFPLALIFLVPLIIVPVNYFVLVPGRARKIFKQQKTLHREIDAAWSEAGYGAQNAPSADPLAAVTPWGDYARWRENEDIVLFFHSDAMFQMLPKRALDPAQLEDIRACARAAGLKGA